MRRLVLSSFIVMNNCICGEIWDGFPRTKTLTYICTEQQLWIVAEFIQPLLCKHNIVLNVVKTLICEFSPQLNCFVKHVHCWFFLKISNNSNPASSFSQIKFSATFIYARLYLTYNVSKLTNNCLNMHTVNCWKSTDCYKIEFMTGYLHLFCVGKNLNWVSFVAIFFVCTFLS